MINLHTVYLQIQAYKHKNPSAEFHVHYFYLVILMVIPLSIYRKPKVGLIISIIVFKIKIQGNYLKYYFKYLVFRILHSTVRESYYIRLHGPYV